MKILISGAGIAGPTLAWWLDHYGFQPTLIERSPSLQTGGYIIDVWGAGFDVARRMGLVPELLSAGYKVRDTHLVNKTGRTIASFPVESFGQAIRDGYVSLARSDLSALIFNKLQNHVPTLFGDTIKSLHQSPQSVHITFDRSAPADFDLVIGADGLHSKVRSLVFGPEPQFEKYLGYVAAAFQAPAYRPRDELAYVLYSQVGQQIGRFAMRDDRTMFLFVFAQDPPPAIPPHDIAAQKALIKDRFKNSGWECPQILTALDASDNLYFDRVSQIRMNPADGFWTRNRVTLLGDAAFCVSLLAGQGSALAMAAAYVLAGELHRARPDFATAFTRYQQLFAPLVATKQKSAQKFAGAFAPKTPLGLFVRNQAAKLMKFPWLANLLIGRDLTDKIVLPDY